MLSQALQARMLASFRFVPETISPLCRPCSLNARLKPNLYEGRLEKVQQERGEVFQGLQDGEVR